MLSLIRPEPVTVIRPRISLDRLGEPEPGEPEREGVEAVVCPGATSDMAAERPNGDRVAYTLHFPKGYGKSLRGCSVEVRGRSYAVVGDPQPYTEANTPGPWNMSVEVGWADG